MRPGLDITLFYITFVFYFAGFLAFSLYAAFKTPIWHKLGRDLMMVALLPHTAAFIARWSLAGHVPLSNMYEYMSLMSWMAVAISTVAYAGWVWKMRGHLVHWERLRKSCECIKIGLDH